MPQATGTVGEATGSASVSQKLTIAVTGGAGHFGGSVLRRLVNEPSVQRAISLDVRAPAWSHPKLEAVVADIRDADFGRHLEGVDTVVHLAFLISLYKPRALYESINIEGSRNVFRAALAAGVSQLVYSSSAAAYGMVPNHPVPIVEDTPRVHQPDFSYNDAKFRVEAFLDTFESEHPELIVTRFRMVAALGPGMESLMGKALVRGYIPNTSDVPWPIVWGDDAADALVLAILQRVGGAFNLSASEPMTASELAAATGMRSLRFPRWLGMIAANASNLAAKLGFGSALDPAWIKYSDAVLVLSNEKARRVLGWQPSCKTTFEVLQRFRAEAG